MRVVAPCLWAGPCPALARERDWCHDAALEPVEIAGQRPRRVDFSYLALRKTGEKTGEMTGEKTGEMTGEPSADPSLFRIVSDPLVEKGRLRFFGCGPSGRHPLVRLDRHRTPANQAFTDLARGDLIRVQGTTPAADGERINSDTAIENLSRRPDRR